MFDEALGLWRGSPYAEFASEEFAAAEVARLVELRARVVEERSAALLELGRPGEVIGELESEIAAEPYRERLRALLMLALARAGRPVESLRAYEAFRRFLADEVGVVPSPGLQELNDDIVRQQPDVSWARSPTLEASLGNLPLPSSSFVGRDVELVRVADALERSAGRDPHRSGRGRQDPPGVAGRGRRCCPDSGMARGSVSLPRCAIPARSWKRWRGCSG